MVLCALQKVGVELYDGVMNGNIVVGSVILLYCQ